MFNVTLIHMKVDLCCEEGLIMIIHDILWWTVGTVVGTVVAYLLVPMQSLGQDGWKIAASLMGSYIGGGKVVGNFVALTFGLGSYRKYRLIWDTFVKLTKIWE